MKANVINIPSGVREELEIIRKKGTGFKSIHSVVVSACEELVKTKINKIETEPYSGGTVGVNLSLDDELHEKLMIIAVLSKKETLRSVVIHACRELIRKDKEKSEDVEKREKRD